MRVGVPGDHIEDHRIEQFQHIGRRPCGDTSWEAETILESRAALAGVFDFWRHSERLAEILLMDAAHSAIVTARPVIALSQQERSVPHNSQYY